MARNIQRLRNLTPDQFSDDELDAWIDYCTQEESKPIPEKSKRGWAKKRETIQQEKNRRNA
jgi:hypothetical protein